LFHLMLPMEEKSRLSTISDMKGGRNYVPYCDTKTENRLCKLEMYSFYSQKLNVQLANT
jgi:hypothetical protein